MYQTFGVREVGDTKCARFRVFVPDSAVDAAQYQRGALPQIAQVHVIGDFQASFGKANWTPSPLFRLKKKRFTDPEDKKPKGWLYELKTKPLKDGFYQYKLHVTYTDGTTRIVCDPCTRYGGISDQNSGFVIGGPKMTTTPLANPRPLNELVLYELMIDDFTATIRGNKAPLAVVRERLDYLQRLGVNAIQFMPWTQWPGENYSWGYEPQGFFAVAFPYTLSPADASEKLFLLKRLISDCHERGMHVLLDGVFDHVTGDDAHRGFGYRWLWKEPNDSPYVGDFAGVGYGKDLDFHNGCTVDFIFDVCRYWIEEFAIDGIRFDYTAGFYDPQGHKDLGLPVLMTRLRQWLDANGRPDFPLILEHDWTYGSIDVANKVDATSCWLDPPRGEVRDELSRRHVRPSFVDALNFARDFGVGKIPVTYIENHDHESLMLNAGSREEWWRTQPYVIAWLTGCGDPMIHNGQEFAQIFPMPEPGCEDGSAPSDSQDPYRKRVVPRRLLWSQADDGIGRALFDLYRRLIDIRRNHAGLTSPNFHPPYWEKWRTGFDADGFGIDEARQLVVYHRWGNAADGHLEKFYIVLNFSQCTQPVELTFPEDDGWIDLLSDWRPTVIANRLWFDVGPNWGHIFYKKY